MTDLEDTQKIDPAGVTTPAELSELMDELRAQADLSQRKIFNTAAEGNGMVPLPRATLSQILDGTRFPTKEQLLTFVRVCNVTDEAELAAWEAAWEMANAENQRYGNVNARAQIMPVSTLLEAGPDAAALLLIRRSIPEAAKELSKAGPGTAGVILAQWPAEVGAEILAMMDRGAAASLLLALRRTRRATELLEKMRPSAAAKLVALMPNPDAGKLIIRSSAYSQILAELPQERRTAIQRIRVDNWLTIGSALLSAVYAAYFVGEHIERYLELRRIERDRDQR